MSKLQDKRVYVRLEALSPVYIGAGNANISPLEYQIIEENGEYWLYTIDLDAWLSSLTNPEKVLVEFEKNYNDVWRYVKAKLNPKLFTIAKSKTSKNIFDRYIERLRFDKSANELAMATRNPLNQAMLIPGSSIKGAMRTAIIDSLDYGKLRAAYLSSIGEYEAQIRLLFGEIKSNAFQALKVSDFELLPNQSEFVEAIEKKKNPKNTNSNKGMKTSCEVMPVSAQNIYGELFIGRFNEHITKAKEPLANWSFNTLRNVCNSYYISRFMEEKAAFYQLSHFINTKEYIEKIEQTLAAYPEAILLRIGHYSHIECMTVKNHILPKVKNKTMTSTSTRTLANGVYPFGWVLLHKVSEEEYFTGIQIHQAKSKEISKKSTSVRNAYLQEQQVNLIAAQARKKEEIRQNEIAKQEKELQELQEQKRLQVEKLQRELVEEQAKQKAEEFFASLDFHAQLIYKLENMTINNDEVIKLFEMLDELNNKQEIAQKLKKYWQKNKKWNPKDIKGAQESRVQKINNLIS